MNWDDLRVAVAVHRSGSFAAAAASLGVDETTVSRRIARLERSLGHAVFQAVDGVRQPTEAGRALLEKAVQIQKMAAEIVRTDETVRFPRTTLRIATTDSIAAELLAPNAGPLLVANPRLTLHFLASTENVNFSRWEADLAVRLRRPERGEFLVKRLSDLDFYYVEPSSGGAEALLCAYPDDLAHAPELQYLIEDGRIARRRLATKNLLVIQSFIRSGSGAGVLPGFMASGFLSDPAFRATRLECTRGVWLLLQPHLKEDPLVRVVVDWIRACFVSPAER